MHQLAQDGHKSLVTILIETLIASNQVSQLRVQIVQLVCEAKLESKSLKILIENAIDIKLHIQIYQFAHVLFL